MFEGCAMGGLNSIHAMSELRRPEDYANIARALLAKTTKRAQG